MKTANWWLTALMLLLLPIRTWGQPVASLDARGQSVGLFTHHVQRTFERPTYDWRPDWDHVGLFVSAGIAGRAVVVATGTYQPPSEYDSFPGRIYAHYGIGGGATLYPVTLEGGRYRFGLGLRAYRLIWHDESIQRFDKVNDEIAVTAHVERRFGADRQGGLVWLGPSYVKNRLFEYRDVQPATKLVTTKNFGATIGGSLVLWNHLAPYAQVTVLEHLQPNIGLAYRF